MRDARKARPGAAVTLAVAVAVATAVATAACGSGATAHRGAGAPATSGPGDAGAVGAPSRPASSSTTAWTVYHRYVTGSGNGPAHLDLSRLRKAWVSPQLDGTLYGEPLVYGRDVFVATEHDTVYELSAARGTVVWSRQLGTPVPARQPLIPCGNIAPTVGITGTPVIDVSRNEIFVVADEYSRNKVHHEIYGLALSNGHVMMEQNADPPGVDRAGLAGSILQRVSLTLDGNEVVFGYGGNDGDCEPYHGWIESVPVTGGKPSFFEVDAARGNSQGAVWMGGAAPVIRHGGIWVAVGNGSVKSSSQPYDNSDSVLELSPSLKRTQFFAPATWAYDNAHDLDLGSSAPAVLPNGLVVQAGKSQKAYLLRGANLGGIGHPLQVIRNFCGAAVDGGVAYEGSTLYLPCENGVVALATNAKTQRLRQLWQTPAAGGPPILAGGYVWTMGGGSLYALSPASGGVVEQEHVGTAATDFPTPAVGDGLILADSSNRVHAFRGS